MAGREHEAVAVGPRRIGRVVAHVLAEEHVGDRRERHRGAGVAGVGLLHRVHGEAADGVDRERLDVSGGHATPRRGRWRKRSVGGVVPALRARRPRGGPVRRPAAARRRARCVGPAPCAARCRSTRRRAWRAPGRRPAPTCATSGPGHELETAQPTPKMTPPTRCSRRTGTSLHVTSSPVSGARRPRRRSSQAPAAATATALAISR